MIKLVPWKEANDLFVSSLRKSGSFIFIEQIENELTQKHPSLLKLANWGVPPGQVRELRARFGIHLATQEASE